ncbi:MAG: polysaccharide export protein [Candidatus Gastranaerophilales bacterium]|nr:polysaccharide export protein [Candidatus Gastranaerophilales bacterium]
MKKLKILLVLILLQLQVLSANANDSNQYDFLENSENKTILLNASKSFQARKYVLGPNDIISISIYGVPEFKQEQVRIQPDGKIVIMPLGAFNVSGLTIDKFQELLVEKCQYYIKKPIVSVKLIQSRPFVVYITGAVVNPGSYELNTTTNASQYFSKPEASIERKSPLLSNVLIAAGGIEYDADLRHVKIINEYDNSKQEVDLLDLIENGHSSQDIYLTAGDSIHVPKLLTPLALSEEEYKKYVSATFSPKQVPVKVLGYINKPGLIKLETADSLDLNSAISAAGGYFNDSAYAPKKVFISRVDNNGKFVTQKVNPMQQNVMLRPHDIVYVPEKTRPLIGKSFDYIARLVSPVSSVAGGYNNWALMFDPQRYR